MELAVFHAFGISIADYGWRAIVLLFLLGMPFFAPTIALIN